MQHSCRRCRRQCSVGDTAAVRGWLEQGGGDAVGRTKSRDGDEEGLLAMVARSAGGEVRGKEGWRSGLREGGHELQGRRIEERGGSNMAAGGNGGARRKGTRMATVVSTSKLEARKWSAVAGLQRLLVARESWGAIRFRVFLRVRL